jgi:hypothetical protein
VDLQELKVKFEVDRIQLFLEKLEDAEIEWFWQAISNIHDVFPNIDIYLAGSVKGKGYIGFGIKPNVTENVKDFLLVSHLKNNDNGNYFFKLEVIQALADFIAEHDPKFSLTFSYKNLVTEKFADWLHKLKEYAIQFGMTLNGQGLLPLDYPNQSLTAAQAVEYLKERYPDTYSGTSHIATFKTSLGREIALDPGTKTPIIFCDAAPPVELNLKIKQIYSETDTRNQHLSAHAKSLRIGNKIVTLIINNQNDLEKLCNWYENDEDQLRGLENKVKAFLELWPIDRVKNMTIEEYHQAKSKDCFIAQIDNFDPTQGDPTFTCYFDIWESVSLGDNDKYYNQRPYSWNKRLGDTPEQAFQKIKQEILDIVDAVQHRDLNAIDQIQFTKGLKWMIAFLYQDFNDPFIIPIVSKVNTKRIGYDHLYPKLPLPEFLPLLLADKGEQQFFPYVEKLFAMVRKGYLDNKQKKQQTEELMDEVMTQQPLNRILFGAAGTGKTFHTINHALSIIENKTLESLENEDRTVLKKRFDEYKSQGQIKFVTFHQSFSYEDFVEGIRAETDDKGNLKYPIKAGVFKEIVELAKGNVQSNIEDEIDLSNKKVWKMSLGKAGIEDDLYRSCLDNNVILLGWGDAVNFSKCENIQFIKSKLAEVNYPKDSEDTAAGYVNTFKNKIQNGDLVVITDGNLKFRAIAEVTGNYEYDENQEFGYHQLRKVNWLKTFSPSLKNEDYFKKIFSQSTVYNLENAVDKSKLSALLQPEAKHSSNLENKYVLIVDEINRGNISRIFGELITLIEDSKREGADEALSVTLPYSKKEFCVPDNVYLIGTMNSSDRSLTGLDIALRRRFTFIEMPPKPELLNDVNVEDIDVQQLLTVINQRIEVLLDRDHCIGHANFMSLKDQPTLQNLADIFKQRIIPQLQEYFFDDWSKINMVLNANGMLKPKAVEKSALFPNVDTGSEGFFEDQKTWELVDSTFDSIESFTKIIKH